MSFASAIKYILTNGLLMFLGVIHHVLLTQYNFIIRLLSFIFKNVLLVSIVNFILKIYRKREGIENSEAPTEAYRHEFKLDLLKISCLEFAAYEFLIHMFPFSLSNWSDMLYFIPISFLYEILFDFFHYWTHRFAHSIPYIYKNTHKLHHRNIALLPIITFVQDPFDLFLTNLMPILLTLTIIFGLGINVSMLTYVCIMMYKSYIEIAGHAPIENTKSCSFPQFIWLPKLLGIELYAKNHNRHHSYPNVNFSKRFSLWDRVFGTWKE